MISNDESFPGHACHTSARDIPFEGWWTFLGGGLNCHLKRCGWFPMACSQVVLSNDCDHVNEKTTMCLHRFAFGDHGSILAAAPAQGEVSSRHFCFSLGPDVSESES